MYEMPIERRATFHANQRSAARASSREDRVCVCFRRCSSLVFVLSFCILTSVFLDGYMGTHVG
jgi:hypothetical protein